MEDYKNCAQQANTAPSTGQCLTPDIVPEGRNWTAKETVLDHLKRERSDLITRLAAVHQDIKEVDNIPDSALEFFLRNRYRW